MTMTPGGAATDATLLAMKRQSSTFTATILNGQSLSNAIDLGGGFMTRIEMPAAWTGAALTFQVSSDGVTYHDYYDADGTEISIAAGNVVVNRAILPTYGGALYVWASVRYLKIRSGLSASPVNQAADRTLTIFAGLQA